MKYIIFSLLLLATGQCIAQGCSDAGFCSAGAMQLSKLKTDTAKANTIGFALGIAKGEQSIDILIPQLEYTRLLDKGRLEIKLPYYIANGDLGNNSGISDPVITYTHILRKNAIWTWEATGGLRISTGTANADISDSFHLPMPYQANLGTKDLILGASVGSRWLSVALGYQQPLVQYNENEYIGRPHVLLPVDVLYFSSRHLKRKGDVLLRVNGQYNTGNLSIAAGPLLIYHLGNDEIEQRASNVYIEMEGSRGLTLNLTGYVGYSITKRWKVDVTAGTPLVVRDSRPDGLTREWVITPRVNFVF